MGRAILIKDGIKTDDALNAQTIQAAASNGTAADATAIDLTNALSATNRPQLVSSSTTNAPTDLNWGVKRVILYSSTAALIVINGVNADGVSAEWHAIVSVTSGTTTIGSWLQVLNSAAITALSNKVDDLTDRVNDITNLLMIQAGILNGEDLT